MLVQGWSEAYWVQPRNEPLGALRVTMTPARRSGRRADGGAEGLGAAGRVTGDDQEVSVAALTEGGAVAAKGGVEAGRGLAGAGPVEAAGAAGRALWRAVAPEFAEAAHDGDATGAVGIGARGFSVITTGGRAGLRRRNWARSERRAPVSDVERTNDRGRRAAFWAAVGAGWIVGGGCTVNGRV